MELVLFLPKCLRGSQEAILAFSEGFSANFLSGYEAVQFIPLFTLTLRRRLVCVHAIRVIFALALSPSLGFSLNLVCILCA